MRGTKKQPDIKKKKLNFFLKALQIYEAIPGKKDLPFSWSLQETNYSH